MNDRQQAEHLIMIQQEDEKNIDGKIEVHPFLMIVQHSSWYL